MATLDNTEPNAGRTTAPVIILAPTALPADDDEAHTPYVGPRTFQPSEAARFFGRDREARDLIARIISERFLLFYAQSGAGKSSLINTRIVPGLEAEGFEVLPIARVSGHDGRFVTAENIYVYNLLSSLHKHENAPPTLGTMSIAHFLDNLVCHDGVFFYDDAYVWPDDAELKPRLLIIDQFEEITTTNTPFWEQREPFFRQLGEALAADDSLWVVLSLREDFLAGLDRYLHLVNNGIRQRFYMQQLNRAAAIEAICRPVVERRPFEPGAVEELVENLMTSRRQDEPGGENHQAEFVEPVQLQAVCYQMWEKLQTRPGPTITLQDVRDFADVDTALVSFYEDTIADTLAWAATRPEPAITETDLRHWFETKLVTESGTRNMVFRGQEVSGDLPTPVADYLRSRFIMREVVRPGGVWYELVHDGFIKPIQDANRKWLERQPLLQLAQQWESSDRSETRLLTGSQFEEFSATKWQALGPRVAAFMEASRLGRRNRERRNTILGTAGIMAVLLFLIVMVVFLYRSGLSSEAQRNELATRNAELNQSNAIKDANATAVVEANVAIQSQNEALSTRQAELDEANEALRASRLVDNAADYLAQGSLEPAILLSYKALEVNEADPTRRIHAVLFNALSRKIEGGTPDSPLRGVHIAPVDAAGYPLSLGDLFTGPEADSLATLVDGVIYTWPVESGGRPPVATPYALPAALGPGLSRAAFHPGQGLLATVADAGLYLWRPDDAADPGRQLPVDGSITSLAFSPDGWQLAVAQACAGPGNCPIYIFPLDLAGEPAPIAPQFTIAQPAEVIDLAFLADGRLAWTDSYGVIVMDPTTQSRETLPRATGQKGKINALAVAPTTNLLIVAGCDDIALLLPDGSTPTPPPAGAPARCDDDDDPWLEWWFLGPKNPANFRLDVAAPLDLLFLPDREQMLFIRRNGTAGVFTYGSVSEELARANACAVAGRNLTAEEWLQANPEASPEAYEPYCRDLPIHTSVLTSLVQVCHDQPEATAAACWSALSARVGGEIDPAQLQAFDERLAAARAGLSAQRRTTSLRYLAEARALARALPDGLRPLINTTLAAEYTALCIDGAVTDSPALSEACAFGSDSAAALLGQGAEAAGDQRLWRFEGQAGQVLIAAVEALESGDATLRLLDGDGTVELAYNDDYNGLNPRLMTRLADDGHYQIEVGWLGLPGRYRLTTQVETPETLPAGAAVAAEADRVLWRFNGRAGDLVNLALDAGNRGNDARLRLLDGNFVEVAFNDDFQGFDPQLDVPLTADGPYYVEVSWNGAPGPYSLTLTKSEVEAIALGDTLEAIDPEQRLWRFDGRAGDYVIIAVTAPNVDADLLLRLKGPSGSELLYSDAYYSGAIDPQREQIETLLLEDGSYTIEVEWRSETVASYTLTTQRIEAAPLTLGRTVEVTPEQPLWRFDGRVGQQISLSAAPLPGNDIFLHLYDAQYVLIGEAYSTYDAPVAQLSTVLTANGPYFVRVGWYFTPEPVMLTTAADDLPLLPLDVAQEAADTGQRWWRYEGQPGEIVGFTVATEAVYDAWLQLRDDQLNVLAYDDALNDGLAQLAYRLPDDGSLFVEVGWSNAPAPYTIRATTLAPQVLTPGEPTLEAGPDQRIWQVTGQAGELMSFAVQALDGADPILFLRNERFEILAANDNFSGLYNPQIAYALPQDGRYYLEVGWNGPPGAYALTASLPVPEALPIERAVTAEAPSLWLFSGAAGDLVTVALDAPGDSYHFLRLLDTRFVELATGTEDGGRPNPRLTYLLPAEGVYFIEVGTDDNPAPYTLRVERAAPVALPLDETLAGGVDAPTVWSFVGRAGDIVTAAVEALDDGDTYLGLYDAQHFELAYSDDFDDLNPRLIARLPADGLYTLEMGWQDWSFIEGLTAPVAPRYGPYRLTAAVVPPEPLTIGESVTDVAADRGLWRFTGRAGDVVTLAAEALAGGDNPWLRLLDEQFQTVAFNDNADGLNPRLSVELPADGDYFIEVGWFGEAGTYRLVTE